MTFSEVNKIKQQQIKLKKLSKTKQNKNKNKTNKNKQTNNNNNNTLHTTLLWLQHIPVWYKQVNMGAHRYFK